RLPPMSRWTRGMATLGSSFSRQIASSSGACLVRRRKMRLLGTEVGLALVVTAAAVAMTAPASRWTTILAPVSEVSGAVVGTAELDSDGPGTSTAKVSIQGDRPGAIRPWHVHH